ncbi:MAG: HAD family phosphatase [Prevotella sp.]|nr:HAD family phosphatase [Prevotella sp.]
MIKAALFDLDGVILDTESQYTKFWGAQLSHYFPDTVGLEQKIKGMTLTQIYDRHFADWPDIQKRITQELDSFERNMQYDYIPGFETFVKALRERGVKTAVVTSSNLPKMENVYQRLPQFKSYFDRILTSEDFSKSKPDPDCYLKGAACFGAAPSQCAGFEDSINGLKAVRAAGLYCIGLTTTNPRDVVAPMSDLVVADFTQLSIEQIPV